MKVAPHIVDLMHAKIDGIISDQENDELEDFFGKNPEAREHMDQLEQVAARLDGLQMVAPPPALRTRVLAAIRPSKATPFRQSPPARRTALGYAYAVAAGLILGILGYHVVFTIDRSTVDPTDVVATMSPHGAETAPTIFEEVPLAVADGSGMVRLEQVPGGVSLLFELDSPQAVDVVLAFDGMEVGFRGFTQDLGEIGDLQVTNESIAWTQSGHHRLAVVVSVQGTTASTVDLQLSTAGETPFNTTLRLPEPQ
jgi:hypothetical protein